VDTDAAAQLLERLLVEPALRARFHRDAAQTCREEGFGELAEEFDAIHGRAAHTLDPRESKSSLAGVLVAAAVEGAALEAVWRQAEQSGGAVADLVSRVDLPALPKIDPKLPDFALPGDSSDDAVPAVPQPTGADEGAGAQADEPAPAPDTPAAEADGGGAGDRSSGASKPPESGGSAPDPAAPAALSPTAIEALRIAAAGHKITAVPSADGRSVEIVEVDGEPVDDGNVAARAIAQRLGELDASVRPARIGTPWRIKGDGYAAGSHDRIRLHFGSDADADADAGSRERSAPKADVSAREVADAKVAPPAGDEASLGRLEGSTAGDKSAGSHTLSMSAVDPSAQRAGREGAGKPEPSHTVEFAAQSPGSKEAADRAETLAIDGPLDYPGDHAPRSKIAAWMAAEAHRRGIPGELPVMAALVESDLSNADHGLEGSLGYFQMRAPIWNKGKYAGYANKPELQLKWFLDHAQDVKRDRIRHGKSVTDPKQFGEWVADVEKPADRYRDRYQHELGNARRLLRHAGVRRSGAAGLEAAAPPAVRSVEAGHVGMPDHPTTGKEAGRAALANHRLHFDDVGVADLKAGRIDPRIIAVLTRISKDHVLEISCMRSDHPKFVASGRSISNHWHGRGVDIAKVDGKPVSDSNAAARRVAHQLARLDHRYRPNEVGTPWEEFDLNKSPDTGIPGFFNDPAHENHIHVGFKSALPKGWSAPADVVGDAQPRAARAGAELAATPPGSHTLGFPVLAERAEDAQGKAAHSLQMAAVKPADPAPEPGAEQGGPEDVAGSRAGGAADALVSGGAGPRALAAVAEARKYLGDDYLWGGTEPKKGFDCSGLTQWAYARQGIKITRTTYTQIDAPNGRKVGLHQLRPGDLVFFANTRPDGTKDVHHVGMMVSPNRFIHAPHTGDQVKISRLSEPQYQDHFAGGRRFDHAAPRPEAPQAAAVPDPKEVADAEAARLADAEALKDRHTLVFKALTKQETSYHAHTLQFMKAVDPPEADRLQRSAADAGIDPLPDDPSAADYPGDGASKAALARWMAAEAQRRGLPPELPVMAALVESTMKNRTGGDADSVGFFQMQTGVWNKGKYAGYAKRPELQIRWFIDQALAIKREQIAKGHRDFGRDPADWGEWIANIEDPAPQFRGKYAKELGAARALLRQ
jgi:cell wall-associated NlpC family hydrolase